MLTVSSRRSQSLLPTELLITVRYIKNAEDVFTVISPTKQNAVQKLIQYVMLSAG